MERESAFIIYIITSTEFMFPVFHAILPSISSTAIEQLYLKDSIIDVIDLA
jgi:hypothetical protein